MGDGWILKPPHAMFMEFSSPTPSLALHSNLWPWEHLGDLAKGMLLMSVNSRSDSRAKGPREVPQRLPTSLGATFHLQLTQDHSVVRGRHSLHLHW